MAPQQNDHNIQNTSSNSLYNRIVLPLVQQNDTSALKSVHSRNMTLWDISNHSFINKSVENRNITINSSLHGPKREQASSLQLSSSLNIWITHGL